MVCGVFYLLTWRKIAPPPAKTLWVTSKTLWGMKKKIKKMGNHLQKVCKHLSSHFCREVRSFIFFVDLEIFSDFFIWFVEFLIHWLGEKSHLHQQKHYESPAKHYEEWKKILKKWGITCKRYANTSPAIFAERFDLSIFFVDLEFFSDFFIWFVEFSIHWLRKKSHFELI